MPHSVFLIMTLANNVSQVHLSLEAAKQTVANSYGVSEWRYNANMQDWRTITQQGYHYSIKELPVELVADIL